VTYVKCPCKGCPDRVIGCHSECGRYIAYVEAIERVRQVRLGILRLYSPTPRMEKNIRNKLNRTKHK